MPCPSWPHFHRYLYKVKHVYSILWQDAVTSLLSLWGLNPPSSVPAFLNSSALDCFSLAPHGRVLPHTAHTPLSTYSKASAIVRKSKDNNASTGRKEVFTLRISYYVQPFPETQLHLKIETAWIYLHLNTMTPWPLWLALNESQTLWNTETLYQWRWRKLLPGTSMRG